MYSTFDIREVFRRKSLTAFLILFICLHISIHARHSIAPAFHYTYIKTTEGDQYSLYSPALNYLYDFGLWDYRLYLGCTVMCPVWASQEQRNFYNPDYYSTYMGADLFIGISRNYEVTTRWSIVPTVGWHQNGIRLRGKSTYLDFYSLTSGLGFNFLTKYQNGYRWFNYAFLLVGADFMDHLYKENKLKRGLSVSAGIGHSF